jgi:hypothetical protein
MTWKRLLLLHAPVALLASGLLAFVAFHAWPLSPVGRLFDGRPGDLDGWVGQAMLLAVPLWYVAGYGLLARFRPAGPGWMRPVAGLLAAAFVVGASFADLLAAGFAGREGTGGVGLWPIRAVAWVAAPVTAPLRKRHYLAHLRDPDPRARIRAADGLSIIASGGGGKGDVPFQRAIARAMASPDAEVRSSLRLALQRSHPLEHEALLLLVDRLADAPDAGRAEVAELLGTLGVYGQEEPELRDGLRVAAETDPAASVRSAAAAALSRIDGRRPAPVEGGG